MIIIIIIIITKEIVRNNNKQNVKGTSTRDLIEILEIKLEQLPLRLLLLPHLLMVIKNNKQHNRDLYLKHVFN